MRAVDQPQREVPETRILRGGERDRFAQRPGLTPIIEPSRGWRSIRFRELWEYRELLYFLVWRDVKVRYKQTLVGVLWTVIQPIALVILFTFIFGRLARLPSDGIPYPLFFYAAYLPWQLFSRALADSANSLVTNQQLITKIFFPRLLIPVAPVIAGLVDFGISFVVLVGFIFYYGIVPSAAILLLPLFILLAVVTACGAGILLSALNVQYRDVEYTLPFLTQLWFFVTPIAYATTLLPESWRIVYGANPMAGVVEGFRWTLLGTENGFEPMMAVSACVAAVLLGAGATYFRRVERSFADLV